MGYTIEVTKNVTHWIKEAKNEADAGNRLKAAKIVKDNTDLSLSDIITVLNRYKQTGKFYI